MQRAAALILDPVVAVRLITRNDTSLAVALIAATIILFQQPLRHLLDLAQDIELRYHLDLVPALLLLMSVFLFHQYRKRELSGAEAQAAAVEAEQARARSGELERLMTFGQALANALDRPTLQQVLWKALPAFARDREFWMVVRKGNDWDVMLNDVNSISRPGDALEQLARSALGIDGNREAGGAAVDLSDDACFPLYAGGAAVGVLGVSNRPPVSEDERKMIGAAAALVAIAVKNMQLFVETRELTLRDGLTGCFNRAHALETLDLELRRARRSGSPLSIMMFDIDHFKNVNDQLGHLRGDEALSMVGVQLGRILRSTDVRSRYGGDEFLVILPDTPVLGAQQVAECMRLEMANVTIAADGKSVRLTISIGVAAAGQGELDAKALVERADEALYRAKRSGRNRFCVAIPPSTSGSRAENSVVNLRQ